VQRKLGKDKQWRMIIPAPSHLTGGIEAPA
jgi:hypothetical protein